jgi:hypothetical protein
MRLLKMPKLKGKEMEKNQIAIYTGAHKTMKTNDGMAIQLNDEIHTLNYTACEIYELCNNQNSIDEIIQEMKFRYPDNNIEDVIEGILIRFLEAGLIKLTHAKES